MRFVITTHAAVAGVGLALCGHFGGERYADDAAAAEAARTHAKGRQHKIERERVRARKGS